MYICTYVCIYIIATFAFILSLYQSYYSGKFIIVCTLISQLSDKYAYVHTYDPESMHGSYIEIATHIMVFLIVLLYSIQ